ncbi:hypothetical protein PEBR_22893 [Penicillium brasilianum]|uniref:Uncharacterized protein n=1 Tax=Penicillium brasilianum TaxID=104259 RepID=A0A1S9RL98_PENBI|nr:hypothetical protein PEBR_22893 [Penicillium brasilianum]
MADDQHCSLSTSILSSLVGLLIGLSIFILQDTVIKRIKKQWAKERKDPDIELQSHALKPSLDRLASDTRRLTVTTVKTEPGHALSDMDRDIKRPIADCQEIRDLQAAIFGNNGESTKISYGS